MQGPFSEYKLQMVYIYYIWPIQTLDQALRMIWAAKPTVRWKLIEWCVRRSKRSLQSWGNKPSRFFRFCGDPVILLDPGCWVNQGRMNLWISWIPHSLQRGATTIETISFLTHPYLINTTYFVDISLLAGGGFLDTWLGAILVETHSGSPLGENQFQEQFRRKDKKNPKAFPWKKQKQRHLFFVDDFFLRISIHIHV